MFLCYFQLFAKVNTCFAKTSCLHVKEVVVASRATSIFPPERGMGRNYLRNSSFANQLLKLAYIRHLDFVIWSFLIVQQFNEAIIQKPHVMRKNVMRFILHHMTDTPQKCKPCLR